jgi:hypothetical protein
VQKFLCPCIITGVITFTFSPQLSPSLIKV